MARAIKGLWLFSGGLLWLGWGVLEAQSTTPLYMVDTVAGGFVLGDNGPATSALFQTCERVAVDPAGNYYIADTGHHRVRKVAPSGYITTIAGDGTPGSRGDGQSATAAQLNGPRGLALDSQGNLYIADTGNNRIRKVSPQGVITTFAGSTAGAFASPRGVAVDASGNVYVADTNNDRIVKVTPSGQLSVPLTDVPLPNGMALDGGGNLYIAAAGIHCIVKLPPVGEASVIVGNGAAGFSGDGANALAASLRSPTDIVVDRNGTLYIADSGNGRIRRVSSQGTITTMAGASVQGFTGDIGDATLARLSSPQGLALYAGGDLLIAEAGAHRVRKVDTSGIIRTVAGADHGRGDGGPATEASLQRPRNVVLDRQENLVIADTENHRVRTVARDGTIRTIAGTGVQGAEGDGRLAVSAQLSSPGGLAVGPTGDIYIGEITGYRVRKRNAVTSEILTLAGTGVLGGSGDSGGATSAQLGSILGLALDPATGNLYLADASNHRVRLVTPGSLIERVAGVGGAGSGGDGGPAILAGLNSPQALAWARDGSLYIADTNNHRVRKIDPSGVITTIAGDGVRGFSGDKRPAKLARLSAPGGVALDGIGNLYVADTGNNRIRVISTSGDIDTIAGTGTAGFRGDGAAAISADFSSPEGLAVDSAGNIYVADRGNFRIRKLSPTGGASLAVISGGDQTGLPGTTLAAPLTVRFIGVTGVPVPGIAVTFAVTEGSATLSASSVSTGTDGTASVTVTLGAKYGRVVVTASAPNASPVRFYLTVGVTLAGNPTINAGGIVGAGLSSPPVTRIAPNGLFTIFGANFLPEGAGRQVGAGDLVGGQLPLKLLGICVQVGNDFAPVVQAFPNQVSAQAPRYVGDGRVQVWVNCREPNEIRSNIETVATAPTAPEFFYFTNQPDGRNPIAAINAVSGVRVGPLGLVPGVTFAPASPGDWVALFGTGFGVTDPPFFAGELPGVAAQVTVPVAVRLGDRILDASDILYTGVTPGNAGLYQLNIRLPDDTPGGDLPVVLNLGGVTSPQGPYITVKR